MKTFSILKACVAVAFSVVAVASASAQHPDTDRGPNAGPATAVGERQLLQQGQFYSIWEERLENPADNFRAYNVILSVNAGGPAGRFINAFEELNITGVHQLWEDFRGATPSPYPGYFTGFSLPGQELDSHVLWTKAQQSNGADPSEVNDGSNPAGLSWTEFDSIVGYGEVGVSSRGGAPAALGLAVRNGELNLARVVLYDGASGNDYTNAWLSGSVGGEGDGNEGNGGEIDSFAGVVVGNAITIPEPAMGLMALIGSCGMLMLRRRNG